MTANRNGHDPDFERRLDRLGAEIDKVAPKQTRPGAAPDEERGRAMGMAVRLASELVAGLFVGGAAGWGLDYLLGTRPWLLIVFLILGAAAGLLNTVRAAQRMKTER